MTAPAQPCPHSGKRSRSASTQAGVTRQPPHALRGELGYGLGLVSVMPQAQHDAELLRDCGAVGELSRLVALGGDAGRALILGGDAESIGVGFSGWQVEAKRARRGCLAAPSTTPEGDLIGMRLSRDVLGQPPRPGRCLLHVGDGKLVTVTIPAP